MKPGILAKQGFSQRPFQRGDVAIGIELRSDDRSRVIDPVLDVECLE